ERFGRLQT
ncbi:putative hc protease EUO, partial [Chlamydia psittaci 06-1683]